MTKPVRHRKIEVICLRTRDQSLWMPSHPPDYNDVSAMVDLVKGRQSFYFLGIRRVRSSIHRWFDCWEETGEVWEPCSAHDFDVLKERDALAVS